MPKGGPRMGSGPVPDPNALRRSQPSDRNGWTILPASRTGPIPPWPLRTNDATAAAALGQAPGTLQPNLPMGIQAARADAREATIWATIWASPQAVAWEALGWTYDVALYVRWLVMAEAGDMKAASESRQWSDRLGLNPAAMLRNRWKVSTDEVGEQRGDQPAKAATRSSRSRLTVVSSVDQPA